MIAPVRPAGLAVLALALAGTGCETQPRETSIAEPAPAATPEATVAGKAGAITPAPEPDAAPSAEARPTKADEPAPTATLPEAEPKAPASAKSSAAEGSVTLEKATYDALLKRIAANKDAKYTVVDAWATWCGPCKENFPHVVAMHQKFADKGLAVVSLSFDDPANEKQVEEARAFLNEKKAAFTNLLLDEGEGVGFEKFGVNSIPAVFLYGPDGKEIKRFTMDDPNHQFTYDEVEKTVEDLLAGKPLPKS
jgi:thiol-disulfide isomerase/thioredoxin